MEGKNTIVGIFCLWWYKEALSRFLAYLKMIFVYLTDFFSVLTCINTLFDPWKRDQLSYSGLAMKERFEAFVLNLSSRFIGAFVKLFTLAGYIVTTVALAAFSGVLLLIWLFYPIVLIILFFAIFINA